MTKLTMHPVPGLLQDFFCQRLQAQCNVSSQTIASYRDTFRLLLLFTQQELRRAPHQQCLEDWNVPLILRFLNHLEKKRGNTARTRNTRLAAIRSFMRYVEQQAPEALCLTSRILAIPTKRHERPLLGYLTKPQIQTLLRLPPRASATSQRNRILWMLLYHTGARISEALALNHQDIKWTPSPAVQLHGKGRKQRLVPLPSSLATQLKEWLRQQPGQADAPVFTSRFGQRLSRFGAHKQLRRHLRNPATRCSSWPAQRISPHTLRHTTAMHLLQAGVDVTVIALWLGHESPQTTHHYVELDLQMKRKCLAKLARPRSKAKCFKPGDKLLQFLKSL